MEYLIQDTTLTGIADAIRAKTGGTDPIAVTDMAAQIAAITGGGSEEILGVIWEEQEVAIDSEDGFGGGPADVALVVGTTYTVKWDGVEYECVADVIVTNAANGFGYPFIGNPALAADVGAVGDDNGLPFAILYGPRHITGGEFNVIAVYANDTNNHTVGIYTESIAVEPLLAEQTYEGFGFDSSMGVYMYTVNPSPVEFAVGETYLVKWDGAFYPCAAQDMGAVVEGAVGVGNLVPTGGTGNYEGFIVGCMQGMLCLGAFDSATFHDVGIYKKSSGGGSVEGIAYVTYMNGTTELGKTACMKGDSTVDPVEDGKFAVPTKEPTVDTVYTYAGGWALTEGGEADVAALVDVSEDRTVYAVYNESVREYTINFYDDDGTTLLESLQVPYGQVPSPAVPEKAPYFFDSWTPELSAVTGDADYQAVWKESNLLAFGSCGDAANYELDPDYVLTIYGTGAISHYTSSSPAPWDSYRGSITSIIISEGITSIGHYAFYGMLKGPSVVIPDTVTSIGNYAFGTYSGTNTTPPAFVIPDTVTSIGNYVFNAAAYLKNVTIGSGVTSIGLGAFKDCVKLSAVTFRDTEGWTAGSTALSSDELANTSTAATYLKTTYAVRYWTKA